MSNPDPSYPYDEDEFDTLGADRAPEGVHRARVPWWRQALPFLVVLVLAPLLAFVVVQAVSRDSGGDPEPTASVSSSETGGETGASEEPAEGESETDADGAGDGDATEEPTDDETDTTDESADLDFGAAVWVLNGAGVGGLAGENQGVLTAAGWTNVVADDYAYSQPATTTIYYRDAEIAAEAEAIGAELGITDLVEDAAAAPNGIYVVLRPDFVG
ncbi:LytR C-terminal domain-containing protein [Ruania rhizosphaerae]|uniref:LytR C-terminal domain-containing protein n=1 Tax=Ruania rhizosphaerae TaxID=1840413 RepID=UPI00135827A2|nr:LytR C-terminal domain-containing protein [Ruania rhizosphaerae]